MRYLVLDGAKNVLVIARISPQGGSIKPISRKEIISVSVVYLSGDLYLKTQYDTTSAHLAGHCNSEEDVCSIYVIT